jgi:predicted nucleotidyltransferase component of viral defense system
MDKRLEELDLPAWVAGAPDDKRHFREAVHIILTAVGTSTALRAKMIMKGGLLMAIRYDSTRFTKDADFSTHDRYAKGDDATLLEELDKQLILASDQLPYDTICRRQRTRMDPVPPEDNDFPGMKLSIGYAPRSNQRAMDRLMNGQSPSVVEIDHSYNEAVFDVEVLRLSDGDTLQAYSFMNLIAEKLRSLLQQPVRRRNREQDVYDLQLLLGLGHQFSDEDRRHLVQLITDSCSARNITVTMKSLRDPTVRQMAGRGYETLQQDVDGVLPPFHDAYGAVQDFFEALPWSDSA